ncbi:rRNA maturation RNase YbeY [Mucisphaera calidilacus]|uniref:Endoribonuclease YbeY n=1 Tax=Mucisphaera calidilacus TaxID=2527982 RepID=A0A518BZ97_9BACT|nr:rRNA maturation RNase YbeY [Mucisphaera calidilacus]QDU72298.1 Endoribonuclease YbeY [Mucisphaera calidilacus]
MHQADLTPDTPLPSDDDPDPSQPEQPGVRDRLSVSAEHELGRTHADWVHQHLITLLQLLDQPLESLSVVFVGDEAMAQLHGKYLDDPTTTDVMTFDLRETEEGPIDGELVICVDEATREADSCGHGVERELLLYAVHGLLHLLGYDDHDPEQAQIMHTEEDRLLRAIGVGAVYAPDP